MTQGQTFIYLILSRKSGSIHFRTLDGLGSWWWACCPSSGWRIRTVGVFHTPPCIMSMNPLPSCVFPGGTRQGWFSVSCNRRSPRRSVWGSFKRWKITFCLTFCDWKFQSQKRGEIKFNFPRRELPSGIVTSEEGERTERFSEKSLNLENCSLCRLQHVFNVSNRLSRIGSV